MGQKLVIGPIRKGLRDDVLPFNIDNDSFPTLINAYQWRQRIKRKRGTSPLGRLTFYLGTTDGAGALSITILPIPLQHGTSVFIVGTDIFTDNDITATASVSLITNGNGTATLNRTTGALAITGSQALTAVNWYPGLPVLGLEPFVADQGVIPQQIAFDTTYSYNIPLNNSGTFYNVSFYNNPASASYNGIAYTQKTTFTPVNWNLQTYQQVWTTNFSGAMWATPGIPSPFVTTNIGMQFKACTTVVYVSATQLTITITEAVQTLVVGDWVFINEVTGTNNSSVNFQTGFVTAAANAAGTTTLTVRFPYAVISNQVYAGGILQYLTNSSNTAKDCIRWFNGSAVAQASSAPSIYGQGWVNFCPPLVSSSFGDFSIANLPEGQYYLVGARLIIPFKDRLLFFGPVIQTSTGTPVYLSDTVIYSQNGTPYYTASFDASTNVPPSALINYTQLIVPTNQTAQPTAWWENLFGFGGFITAGYARPITTVSINEDALIVGFTDRQTRLLYTGNDIVPFNFYVINSELGSDATFSSITLDRGVITFGGRGIILTSQTGSTRIDLEIPDKIFEILGTTQAAKSVCAQRDFINEWIHFTYQTNGSTYSFPTQTLQYNYREETWAIFNESYTTYGTIRSTSGLTWATVGARYATWEAWNVPWNASTSTIGQPIIMAGNAQGFVVLKDTGTSEAPSLSIQNISGSTVTSPNHCLNNNDYITISSAQGTLASSLNGKIFQIQVASTNTFDLSPDLPSGTYLGGGVITRMYIPFIQSKQFPVSWEMARKTRLGPQQYLFTNTPNGQITLLIFLSQDSSTAYNNLEFPNPVQLVPSPESQNNTLIYSTTLYTCPESTNLGLTAANINLQMPTAVAQQQIWHRMNTSLLGDTIQIGFTLNSEQMTDEDFNNQFVEIEFHAAILDLNPSQLLA